MTGLQMFGGGFALIGVVLLRIAYHHWRDRRAFMANSAVAEGVVIGLVEDGGGRDDRAWFPKIRYRTQAGAEFTVQSAMGGPSGRIAVGDRVPMRYRIDQPGNAERDSVVALWGACALIGALGAIFALIGVAALTGMIAA